MYDHHRELTHLFSVCRDLRIIRNLVYYENSCSKYDVTFEIFSYLIYDLHS